MDTEDILQTLTCISKCYLKVKEFELALEFIEKVWERADIQYTYRSKQCAYALVEQANIYAEKRDFTNAIAKQNQALSGCLIRYFLGLGG